MAATKKPAPKSAARKQNAPVSSPPAKPAPWRELVGVVFFATGALLVYFLWIAEAAGIDEFMRGAAGNLRHVVPVILFYAGLVLIFNAKKPLSIGQIVLQSLLVMFFFTLFHVFSADAIVDRMEFYNYDNFVSQSIIYDGGAGCIGAILTWPLYWGLALGKVGTATVLIFSMIGLLILMGKLSLTRVGEKVQSGFHDYRDARAQRSVNEGRRREVDFEDPFDEPAPRGGESYHELSAEAKKQPRSMRIERIRPEVAFEGSAIPRIQEETGGEEDPRAFVHFGRKRGGKTAAPKVHIEPPRKLTSANDGINLYTANLTGGERAEEVDEPAYGQDDQPSRETARRAPWDPVQEPVRETTREPARKPVRETARQSIREQIYEADRESVRAAAGEPLRAVAGGPLRGLERANAGEVIRETSREPLRETMSENAREPVDGLRESKGGFALRGRDAKSEFDADQFEEVDPFKAIDGPNKGTERVEEAPVIQETRAPEAKAEKIVIPAYDIVEDEYQYPPIDLLQASRTSKVKNQEQQDLEKAQKLIDTLASFGISVTLLGIAHGPTVTRYELSPAAGIKVSRITSLADDIALSLAAVSVRIEAPIPGKAAVGVEVPNDYVEIVPLRDVLESPEARKFPSRIAAALGRDNAGNNIVADLAKMPHVLIAGATGAGKSVCINCIICSILYRATPEEVRMIMIDPKVVELSAYNGIPHLLVPVVTDPKKAAGALSWAVSEMTARYEKFAALGVRDIKGYNTRRPDEVPPMPQIVLIIDELADLMMVTPGEVEDAICRLAQLARAAGIHLVIATQRPSVNVITGVIKANIPSRVAFTVASQVDSRTILDVGGAEKLLGRGDMLYAPSGTNKPLRVQGAWISDEEVHDVVEYIKVRHDAEYDEDIIEKMEQADMSSEEKEEADEEYDELLPQAIELVIEAGQASISMLQRKLRVGYARAGRLIDEMAVRGIVSQAEGAKPRNVLITREQFHTMFE